MCGHFLHLYPPNSLKNDNFKIMKKSLEISAFYTSVTKIMIIGYTVPDIWHVTDVIVTFILGYFLPFYPCNSPKYKDFKKMKKMPGDIILHKCTKNYDHLLYCSWDMAHGGCNCYFSFWAIFCPFTPKQPKKWKFKKNEKKP